MSVEDEVSIRKAAGGVLTAKQAPHRPGTAPAPGLRAWEMCLALYRRPNSLRGELSMTARTRLHAETLDDRCLPSFSPATTLPVGTSPQAVVTADFNNDGRL